MGAMENLKKYCEEHRIPLSRIERDLGYSNSSLVKAKSLKDDRIVEICEYLGIPTDYLLKGAGYYENDETAKIAQDIFENRELKALFDLASDSTPEDIEAAYSVLLALNKKGK